MSFTDFKTQIKNIREEAIKLGISDNAINSYQVIWDNYINWKNTEEFIYNSDEYNSFLLDYYNFDINNTNNLKAFQKHLLRSKKIIRRF